MKTVLITKDRAVWTIAINRPEVRNAVDPETAQKLRDAFDLFEEDPDAKVAVLTGTNGTFCSGFDLKRVQQDATPYDPAAEGPMGPTRRTLAKPVIAAIEGHAVAGGLELALWCDMRVASQTAVFGVFCRRWGVPLIDGGTVRLPRIIGQGRAMDMILTGRPVDAEEALIWGLADRVYPEGKALEAALELARDIAAFPQVCLQGDRISALTQWSLDLPDALKEEAYGGVAALVAEAEDGAARFTGGEGRGGSFKG